MERMVLEKFGQVYELARAWSMAADFARLPSRICSGVTRVRKRYSANQETGLPLSQAEFVDRDAWLAPCTNSLLHSGHCR
jgi:hypothetical protein